MHFDTSSPDVSFPEAIFESASEHFSSGDCSPHSVLELLGWSFTAGAIQYPPDASGLNEDLLLSLRGHGLGARLFFSFGQSLATTLFLLSK
jgi:hypothetical protein